MALSPRTNARMGLPANPRSHTFARRANASVDISFSMKDITREYVPSRPAPTPPMSASQEYVASRPAPTPPASQVRLARSMTNLRSQGGAVRSRSLDRSNVARPAETPPPLPIAPSAWQARGVEQPSAGASLERSSSQSKRANGALNSWGSTSSEGSNSGNSLRSYLSFASSQTSLASEDMKSPPSSTPGSPVRSPSSLGNSIWSRVTTAAEQLKVNVSKAISSSVKTQDGEGTPEGQESSLAKALKAYHVEKANGDAKEIPDWLFEGRDRAVIDKLRGNPLEHELPAPPLARTDTAPLSRSSTTSPAPERGRSRAPIPGLRDRSTRDASIPASARASVHATTPSRDNMNRLNELRIAKRNARVRFEGDEVEADEPPPSRAPSRAGNARPVAPPSAFKDVPLPEITPLRLRPSGHAKEPSQDRDLPAVPPKGTTLTRRPTGYTRAPSQERQGASLARRPTGLPMRAPSREGRRSPEEYAAEPGRTSLARRPTGMSTRAPSREGRWSPEEYAAEPSRTALARRPTGLPARAPSREGRRIGLPGNVRPQRI